jgi:acylphosphatase
MALVCKRCVIDGRVQGVFYRASTYEQAVKLGVHGWVRNLPGGQVEALVQGEPAQVERMIDWFWRGPAYSEVISVQCQEESPIDADTFSITR